MSTGTRNPDSAHSDEDRDTVLQRHAQNTDDPFLQRVCELAQSGSGAREANS